MEWHLRSGVVLLGLLVYRAGWGLWGAGTRVSATNWTTLAAFVDHFRGGTGSARLQEWRSRSSLAAAAVQV